MSSASSGVAIGPPWQSTITSLPTVARRLRPFVDARHAVLERQRRLGADGAARGEPHMADDDVGARPSPSPRPRRRRTHRAWSAGRAHGPCGSCRPRGRSPCRSPPDSARKTPSMSPTVGKFCTPEKPSAVELRQEGLEQHEGIGAVDAGQHRRVLHHRQHLARHLDARSRWHCHRPAARRASRGPPCGSGRNCR